MANVADQINECDFLFLTAIDELDHNSLKLVVTERIASDETKSINIAGPEFTGNPVSVTDRSRIFEIVWDSYVAYAVLNESFAIPSTEDLFEGTRFRTYSKSCFLEYMSKASFAGDNYPGPMTHYGIACADHIIEVLSTTPPYECSCSELSRRFRYCSLTVTTPYFLRRARQRAFGNGQQR